MTSATMQPQCTEWICQPDSTLIGAYGYDSRESTLVIEFKKGETWAYYDVPFAIFENMGSAESIGSYYSRQVKGKYTSSKLEGRVSAPRPATQAAPVAEADDTPMDDPFADDDPPVAASVGKPVPPGVDPVTGETADDVDLVTVDQQMSVVRLTPESVFVPHGGDPIIAAVIAVVNQFEGDASTESGRARIKRMAKAVASVKCGVDDIGKDYVAEIKRKSGAIDAERKRIKDTLQELQDAVAAPVTAFEKARDERAADNQSRVNDIRLITQLAPGMQTVEAIDAALFKVTELHIAHDFEDFAKIAAVAVEEAYAALDSARTTTIKRLADEEELARLREEQRVKDQAEHDEQIRLDAIAASEEKHQADLERVQREADDRVAAAKSAPAPPQPLSPSDTKAVTSPVPVSDSALRSRINNEVMRGLLAVGIDEAAAVLVGKAIIAGKVPHVSISYSALAPEGK